MPLHNSHLTTEQFSAFLDQQLSAQEQSTCQTHLNTCDLCKQQLAELQQTVLLVRALPRAPLPRSFVLPVASTRPSEVGTGKEDTTPKRARQAHHRLLVLPSSRTTMRIVSTLVAVLGLFFILSGLLMMVSPAGYTLTVIPSGLNAPLQTRTKAQIPNSLPDTPQPQSFAAGAGAAGVAPSSNNHQNPSQRVAVSSPNAPQPQPSAGAANEQAPGASSSTSHQPPLLSSIQPFFDPATPQGHVDIGLLLLITGDRERYSMHQVREKSTGRIATAIEKCWDYFNHP